MGPLSELNNYFDKIFVITLKENEERQRETAKRLKKHGVSFEFCYGVNGHALDIERLEKEGLYSEQLSLKNTGYPMAKGELGCALSHLEIYKKMVTEKYSKVLIFEDDLVIEEENIIDLKEALKKIPPGWDLLYFGAMRHFLRMPFLIRLKCALVYPVISFLGIKKYDINQIRRSFGRPFNKYWDKAGVHNCTFAYAMSLSGAQKLIKYETPIGAPIDRAFQLLIRSGKLKAYKLVRLIFDQRYDWPSVVGMRPSYERDRGS